MARRAFTVWEDPRDREIKNLKNELYEARRAIIDLMPEKFRRLVDAYYSCTTEREVSDWRRSLVDEVIDMADPVEIPYLNEKRAACPLCGYEGRGFYESGLKVPEGLRRHLEGYGNVEQCSVIHAAWRLARDSESLKKSLAEERQVQKDRLAERRATETLYKVGPSEPLLLEEGIWFDKLRDAESLAWAEDRLKLLGFDITVEGNVRSYVAAADGVVVYADPRHQRHLEFTVVREQAGKRRSAPKNRAIHAA